MPKIVLGDVTVTGGSVFNNIVEEHVTDARMKSFGLVRCGADWGWFPDPWRMVRITRHEKKREERGAEVRDSQTLSGRTTRHAKSRISNEAVRKL